MIQCPLCQHYVLDETNTHTLHQKELCDFNCPTQTIIYGKRMIPHYMRRTLQGCYPEYRLIVGPYILSWFDGQKRLIIYENTNDGTQAYWANGPWKKYEHIEFPEVVKLAKQLTKLKVFA